MTYAAIPTRMLALAIAEKYGTGRSDFRDKGGEVEDGTGVAASMSSVGDFGRTCNRGPFFGESGERPSVGPLSTPGINFEVVGDESINAIWPSDSRCAWPLASGFGRGDRDVERLRVRLEGRFRLARVLSEDRLLGLGGAWNSRSCWWALCATPLAGGVDS